MSHTHAHTHKSRHSRCAHTHTHKCRQSAHACTHTHTRTHTHKCRQSVHACTHTRTGTNVGTVRVHTHTHTNVGKMCMHAHTHSFSLITGCHFLLPATSLQGTTAGTVSLDQATSLQGTTAGTVSLNTQRSSTPPRWRLRQDSASAKESTTLLCKFLKFVINLVYSNNFVCTATCITVANHPSTDNRLRCKGKIM